MLASFSYSKDTESDVHVEKTTRGQVQLVVEQRTVWQNPLLDAGLHWTLTRRTHLKDLLTPTPGGTTSRPIRTSYWKIIDGNFIFILFCLKFVHELHHRPSETHADERTLFLQHKLKEAGEEAQVPRVQKLHHHVVLITARVQEPQVPASDDTVQTSKHALHQPGEDQVQVLKRTKAAIRT